MDILVKPYLSANRLYNKSNERSIESELGESMYNYPIIWDECPNRRKPGSFKVFRTNSDLIQYINSKDIKNKERCFHEVIFGKKPQRLRFDLDIKDNLKIMIDEYDIINKLPIKYHSIKEKHNAIIQYLSDFIFDTFIDIYEKTIKKDYPGYVINKNKIMLITESHNSEKYSFHIIIARFIVSDCQEASWFMRQVIENLEKQLPDLSGLFDQQAYTSTQFFRILNCGKKSDPLRIKKFSFINMNNQIIIDNAFIQHNNTGEDLLISTIHYNDVSPIFHVSNNNSFINYQMNSKTEEVCKEVIESEYGNVFKFKYTKGNLLEYSRLCPSKCSICKRKHDQENAYGFLSNGVLYWNCRRNVDKNRIIELKTIEDCRYDRFDSLKKDFQEITSCSVEELDMLSEYKCNDKYIIDEYNRKEMKDFPLNYDTLYVKAPMKMGKSKKLIKHIKELNSEECIKSICIVSFRRAFTEEFRAKFNDKRTGLQKILGMELSDYKLIDGPDGRQITSSVNPFVIIQVESLHRLRSKYDIVVLDESESIYSQFSSSNIKKINTIITNYKYLISQAKKVICMDAFLGQRTVDITNYLRGNNKTNIKFSINTFENQNKKGDISHKGYVYEIGYCKNHFYNNINKALKNDKKIVVLSNTRDNLDAFEKMIRNDFPSLALQSYTAYSKDAEMQELKDVNKTWLNYTVVMYSPTITAGISFEQKHFDEVFAFFTNMSCDYLSCIQMLGRIRDVSDRKITICLESHFFKGSVTKQGIENDLINGRNELLSIPFDGSMEIDDSIEDDVENFRYIPNKLHPYYHIWIHNQLTTNISRTYFQRLLLYCIHMTGAKIILYNKLEGNGSKLLLEAKKQVVEDRYIEIAESPNPTTDQVMSIYERSERESISKEEKYSLQKYKLSQFYKLNIDLFNNVEFLRAYLPFKTRYKYSNLSKILTYSENMKESIREIAKYEILKIKQCTEEQDTITELNLAITAHLHNHCYQLLNCCGFDHILNKHTIFKHVLKQKLSSCNDIIINALRKHNVRKPNIKSKEFLNLDKHEQYFIKSISSINSVLRKFYGIEVSPIDHEKTIYRIMEKDFIIIEDSISEGMVFGSEDCPTEPDRPFIKYVGYNYSPRVRMKLLNYKNLDSESDFYSDIESHYEDTIPLNTDIGYDDDLSDDE